MLAVSFMETDEIDIGLHPDASELAACSDKRLVCETYIFEPAQHERALGRLYAVAETEDRGGIGSELVDMTVTALQREYYRDPSRGVLASFESALHQANLVLYDSAQHGIRDWMGHFHVVAAVLAGTTLHLSVAGEGTAFLVRRTRMTDIATGLAHSPITNPLRTFSHVASGTLAARDTLFLGSPLFPVIFRKEDVIRFCIDRSAATITTRLRQLYDDQKSRRPVAVLTVSLSPDRAAPINAAAGAVVGGEGWRRSTRVHQPSLTPRKPLVIYRPGLRSSLYSLGRGLSHGLTAVRAFAQRAIWPRLLAGSRQSSRVLSSASRSYSRTMRDFSARQWHRLRVTPIGSQATPNAGNPARPLVPRVLNIAPIQSLPARITGSMKGWLRGLPRSSKIFAALTAVLFVALIISLILLQIKRVEDAKIERASEILHEARTTREAADTALIYNNREQARTLLVDARRLSDELADTGLYAGELTELRDGLAAAEDRLQKISRVSLEAARMIGDFNSVITQTPPRHLFTLDGTVYTYNPENNAIVQMKSDGAVETVSQSTQGIGFFSGGVTHTTDKTLILITDSPGVALFDTKTNVVQPQEITLSPEAAELAAAAAFGSRLYLYDPAADSIMVYTKTLRGYTGSTPWITDVDFPKDTIRSIAIDGNIFTLHDDGAIHRLFKGEEADFTAESVDPPLAGARAIVTAENFANVYVVDPDRQRVVVYTKKGELVRQILLETKALSAASVNEDESVLYVLDGTRVLAVSLAD